MKKSTPALRVSALLMLEADQAIGRQRHDLPGDEEEEGVRGGEHQRRGQQQGIVEGRQHADVLPPVEAPHVAEGIHRQRQRQERDDQHEESAQRIELDGELEIGNQRRPELESRPAVARPGSQRPAPPPRSRTAPATVAQPNPTRLADPLMAQAPANCPPPRRHRRTGRFAAGG